MSMSMYQGQIKRLESEIATLEDKIAKARKEQTKSEKDIQSVERSITRNTSASSLKQKQNKINRLRSSGDKAQDDIAKHRKALVSKRSSLSSAQDKLRKEEQRQDDKRRKTELQHERTLTQEARRRRDLQASELQFTQYFEGVESTEGQDKRYDVFIAHAREDKKDFVAPLAHLLQEKGLDVWFDDIVLRYGDSLRREIDQGIANSRRGVVVMSHAFFAKEWPQAEVDGMMNIQMQGGSPYIFPIWHRIESEDVNRLSPTLAGRKAARTSVMDLEEIANAVAQSVPGFDADEAEQIETEIKAIDLTEEERTLYQGLLNLSRRIFKYWYSVAHNFWYDGTGAWDETVDPEDVVRNARNARDHQELAGARDEIDAFAPDEILDLSQNLTDHVRNCQQRVLYEVRRYGVDDPKQQGPLWREVQVGVRETFDSQDTQATYLDLRRSIRERLVR